MSITINCYYCNNVLSFKEPAYGYPPRRTEDTIAGGWYDSLNANFSHTCQHCGAIYTFSVSLKPTKLTVRELNAIANKPDEVKKKILSSIRKIP